MTITHQFTRKCLIHAAIFRLASTALIYYWDIMIRSTFSTRAPFSILGSTIIAAGMMPERTSFRSTRGVNWFCFGRSKLILLHLFIIIYMGDIFLPRPQGYRETKMMRFLMYNIFILLNFVTGVL